MASTYQPYESMQASELDTHKAQWEVLREAFPETVAALESGKDATKDYNAEVIAATGAPSLPISVGDADAIDKIFKAQNRQRKLDPVNVELAVNWIKEGYQDMKPEEYTAKINAKLGTSVSVSAMKSRAITKLRLSSRRSEGRPANNGELPPD